MLSKIDAKQTKILSKSVSTFMEEFKRGVSPQEALEHFVSNTRSAKVEPSLATTYLLGEINNVLSWESLSEVIGLTIQIEGDNPGTYIFWTIKAWHWMSQESTLDYESRVRVAEDAIKNLERAIVKLQPHPGLALFVVYTLLKHPFREKDDKAKINEAIDWLNKALYWLVVDKVYDLDTEEPDKEEEEELLTDLEALKAVCYETLENWSEALLLYSALDRTKLFTEQVVPIADELDNRIAKCKAALADRSPIGW